MSDHLSYPPCPTCEQVVTGVADEGAVEDRRFGRLDTEFTPSFTVFTLSPCGHRVDGYRADATGVLEWRRFDSPSDRKP